jgi:membrane fusion protein (multidrug efflux system)
MIEAAHTFQELPGVTRPGRDTVALRRNLKRGILGLALLGATVAAADYGYRYWVTGQYLVSTDDAYVKADYTTIAPKVSGYLAQVLVRDNQPVKAGDVLARIDDRDYRTALAQARADVAAAEASVRNLDAQIVQQQAMIEQAKATIVSTAASLKFATADAERYRDLMKTAAGTTQQAQHSEATRDQAAAQLQRDQAGLLAEQGKVAVLTTARAQADAQRDRAQAMLQQAELNLSYTTITAPVAGTVGARSLRLGQYVSAGTQLMAVVPLDAAYIVANFKETQLTHVRDGQPVEVTIDSFPDSTIRGHVDSLSPASGLEFALLPPDNATGNFTKIVQRIPVRIVLDDPALSGLLRAGMSVEPTINTKPAQPAG